MNCVTCQFYAGFEGVCCNGNSQWCADWPPNPETQGCDEWVGATLAEPIDMKEASA